MRRRTLLVILNALLLLQGSLGAQAACARSGADLAQAAHASAPCAEHAQGHHDSRTRDAPGHSGTHDCCHAGSACHGATPMAATAPRVLLRAPRALPCASGAGEGLMRPRPDELLRPPIL
jgi:hypothetical protein